MAIWINIHGCKSYPRMTICVVNQLKNDTKKILPEHRFDCWLFELFWSFFLKKFWHQNSDQNLVFQWPTRPEKDGSGLERHFTEKMDGFLDRSLIWKCRVA